ncbi:MAG: hypothetical protein Q8K68_05460, partial [Nitrospirota bacterium]|nr:hypothetical protein [Nitrospirota bacterium]
LLMIYNSIIRQAGFCLQTGLHAILYCFWITMKKSDYIIWLGVATAAGTAVGLLSDRRHSAKGCLLGATAGMVAGSVAAGVFEYISSEKVPYYSSESSLYDDLDLI